MYKNHTKPQNALKRAQELFAIENYEEALELLTEVVKGKRVSRVWQKDIHEPIMQLYLQACVRLKKSQLAKEGLYQYKALCQSVNIKSLEDVVRDYLKMAKEFTEKAKEKSHQTVLDIDDLDSINSPESVLMSAVSSEDTQDRTNRTYLMPWLRFLWESYRHCMEVFKNHNKLERLYHDIAREAFQFCQEYDRKTEFRRLCDNLRYHLAQVQKYQGVAVTIDLTSEETLDYHTKTRLLQLETAISMDLWLEAFKAIDDFHSLLNYYKKPPKPQTIVDYYQKFALVCFQSCNMVYHAAALLRVYVITRDYKKSFSQEELANLSNVVLLAVLTIPIQPQEGWLTKYLDMMALHTENQRRLCAVLGIAAPPTRQQLLSDMEKYGVLQNASKCLVDLHHSLELSFEPLKMHDKVMESIESINQLENSDLSKYIPLVEPVMVVKVLKQVSEIYKLIKIDRLQEIMHSIDQVSLQNLCLRAARNGDVQLSIDERGGCIVFGGEKKVGQSGDGSGSAVQPMDAEVMRDMMNEVATVLEKSTHIVYPEYYQQQKQKLRDGVSALYLTHKQRDHEKMLERPERIEKRLEDIEREFRAKEEEQVREQQKRDEELKQEEEQRLAREAMMREEERKKEEVKKLEKMRLKEHLEGLKKAGGNNILQDIQDEDLEEMNANDLLARRKEELMKEQRDRVEKLRKEEKRIDHWERAMREVEIPQIVEWTQGQMDMRKQQWDKSEQTKIDHCKEEAEKRKMMRAKCIMMVADKDLFIQRLHENRKQLLQQRIDEWELELAEEKERLLGARRAMRKSERRAQHYARQKREEERLAAEAEAEERRLRKEQEELAARKQEEEEQRMLEERRRAQEKARMDDDIMRGQGLRGSELRSEKPPVEDRWRGGGERNRSPAVRGSGAYQPPTSDRYRPPGAREDGPPVRRQQDEFRRGGGGGERGGGGRDFDDFKRGGDDRDAGGMRRDDFRRRPPDEGMRRGPRDDEFERAPPRGSDVYRPPMRGDRDMRGPERDMDRDRDRDMGRDSNRFSGFDRERGEGRFRGGGGDEMRRGPPPNRDSYGRDRGDRDRESGFSRGTDFDSMRGSDHRNGPQSLEDRPPRGGPREDRGFGGNFRGQEVQRGGGGGVGSDSGTAPIRPFRPREEKKERPQASEDGWTEVRKR
ncbi:eukaryotic translation initiation factor 3 subunit A-like isoform X2 [Convolutriloba macropyga]|uniref:eukaryotic translation initiation factor 3 subunit A-like isoform X2 n=1 Tax=Convolutriloba macropyga TaxID=536237 RepID=UPI003F51C279